MMQESNKRHMKKRLRQYAAACAEISARTEKSGEKEEKIRELLQAAPTLRTRGTRCDFILEQIGYLGRYCLFWQILWVAFFGWLVRYGVLYFGSSEMENRVLVFVSLLPPLLALLTVEEITKVYQRSMLEIEYAAKYSLQSVVLVRMLMLSIAHLVILAVVLIIFHASLESGIGKLFVYGFTPMIVVTGILMKLMQYCHGELLRGAGIAVYVLTVVLAVVGNTRYFGWYQPVYFKVWCAACAAGILFGIWQFVHLRRKLVNFEQIMKF